MNLNINSPIKISPNSQTIDPYFSFDVEFTYESDVKVFYKLDGVLRLENKVVAYLQNIDLTVYNQFFNARNLNQRSRRTERTTFVAPISRLALEKVQEYRLKNRKNEIHFQLDFKVSTLEPKFIAHYENNKNLGITFEDDSLFRSNTYNFTNQAATINAGDWLHEYCPTFNIGKYKVIEVPDLEPTPNSTDEKEQLIKRINASIEGLHKMNIELMKGEWNDVMKESRPVWELLNNKTQISELLKQENYTQQTLDAFSILIENFFSLASKFVHKIDNKGNKDVMLESNAQKEDAYLVYYMAVGIINNNI